MKLIFRIFLVLLPGLFCFSASASFTKSDAADQLKKTGLKWRMTESFVSEAWAKAELLLAKNTTYTAEEKKIQLQAELSALMFFQYLNVQPLERQIGMMNSNLTKSELIYKLAQAKKCWRRDRSRYRAGTHFV